MIPVTGKTLEEFQSSLKARIKEIGPYFNDSVATALIHSYISMILACGKEEVEDCVERASPEQLLKGLIDGIFAEFYWEKRKEGTIYDCYRALIKDGRLNAVLWKRYVDATMSDAANRAIPSIDTAKKLELLMMAAAGAGSIEVVQAIISSFEKAQIKIDLFAKKTTCSL